MTKIRCCVPKCSNTGGHLFPKNAELRRKWVAAVKRENWEPTNTSMVCANHFSDNQYLKLNYYGMKSLKRQLKSDAVPSLFSWCKVIAPSESPRGNREREKPMDDDAQNVKEDNFQLEVVIEDESPSTSIPVESSEFARSKSFIEVSTQTTDLDAPMSVERFTHDKPAIQFYTGLDSYDTFMFILSSLGPAAFNLKYYNSQVLGVSIPNQLFLTLMKLRLNSCYFELSRMFDTSDTTARNIFLTWINFMFFQWKELNIWPEKDLVLEYMPSDFKSKFPTTRVIIDSLECKINKPKNPVAQQATWSTYKNDNTVKAVVGCTPGGLFSFCSNSYGGSTSDRQISERSNLKDLCEGGDTVMADRGFNIEDLLITKDITLNIPHFVRGKNQLPSEVVISDRKIASKRIHIERLIGMARTYKILKYHMKPATTKLSHEIIFVCFMLCNFRPCIVSTGA